MKPLSKKDAKKAAAKAAKEAKAAAKAKAKEEKAAAKAKAKEEKAAKAKAKDIPRPKPQVVCPRCLLRF